MKHENKPNRHPHIDYSLPGYYFLTIIVRDHLPVFGINNHGKIELNNYGIIGRNNGISIPKNYKPDRIGMVISKIIQQYKAAVSREIRKTGFVEFRWQRSCDDHVIRNQKSLNRIRNYIHNNPAKHYYREAA